MDVRYYNDNADAEHCYGNLLSSF